jgi:hypothetical protein
MGSKVSPTYFVPYSTVCSRDHVATVGSGASLLRTSVPGVGVGVGVGVCMGGLSTFICAYVQECSCVLVHFLACISESSRLKLSTQLPFLLLVPLVCVSSCPIMHVYVCTVSACRSALLRHVVSCPLPFWLKLLQLELRLPHQCSRPW